MAFAALVPALLGAALVIWTIETYWAAIGFRSGGLAVLVAALLAGFALTSLAVGRMVRIALDIERQPQFPRGLSVTAGDLRAGLGCLFVFALCLAAGLLWRAAEHLVATAFIAPGSEPIATFVYAAARCAVVMALFYLCGRALILIPLLASGEPFSLPAALRATQGHASILFIVGLAVPSAAGLLFLAPGMIAIGAIPWPPPDAFARIESMVTNLHRSIALLGPLLFLGILSGWIFAAAGLACAWQAVHESSLGRTTSRG